MYIVQQTTPVINADAALLNTTERIEIEKLLNAVRMSADGNDHALIKAAVDALARGTEDFAAKRMDRSVRVALAGKRLDELA